LVAFVVPSHTILVVDDDRKTVASIALYLRHAGFTVATASSGPEAVEAATRHAPSLVILDLMLPGFGGMEACAKLRAVSKVPIIMLTARTDEHDKIRGLESGADDYVTKPFSPRELVARVQAVLRRGTGGATAGKRLRYGDLTIDLEGRAITIAGRSIDLTPTEFRLIEVLAGAPSRCFRRQELVERVFGQAFDGLDRTIDVHIMNLRRKIEPDRSKPSWIVTVYGLGYKFGGVAGAP
jgi:two-component system alkaline phosphatase synthesis response regulator PhoP